MNPHDDLEAHVLGVLEPSEAAAFATHLAACSACRDGVASYGAVLRALHALPAAAPPAPPRTGRPPLGWIAAVAAAAILGIVAGHRTAGPGPDHDAVAVAELMAAQSRTVALAGTAGTPARGTAIVARDGGRTAFVVSGLPPPPPGRGYQVWVRGASVRSPGMMHRSSDGLEILVVPGNALAGARRIGITIEPAGGSPARSGPPRVTGNVS